MATANALPISLKLLRLAYQTLGPVLPGLFGSMAYHRWFTTTRFRPPVREREALTTATIDSIPVDDVDVVTYCWGHTHDPLVLFVHGWSGRGTQVCAFVEPLLQAGFSVLSFDAPAHGQTPGRQTSVLQFVDVLLALQHRHGHFHACITHSVGGMALGIAAQHGFAPTRAVCICPPNDFDTILHNFSRILALPMAVRQSMLQKLYASHGNIIKTLVRMDANMARVHFPGLLIHDRDDPEIPWQDSDKIHHAWPGSRLMLTAGLKHHRIVRDDAVISAALDFLQQA